MPTAQPFPAGGYRFISHQFQYSGGVAAEPGFRIERARLARPLRWPTVLMPSKPTSLIELLARRAGLDKALADFPEDVAAVAEQAPSSEARSAPEAIKMGEART